MVKDKNEQAARLREEHERSTSRAFRDKKEKDSSSEGGRRVIILLLLLTVGLSLLFSFQGYFTDWLRGFFGPSTFIITR